WAGGGIISPLYPWRYDDAVTALAKWSQGVYFDWAMRWLEETGLDPEWMQSGLLMLDEGEHAQAQAWAARWSMNLEIVPRSLVEGLEPSLNEGGAQAIWMRDIAQIRNPKLAQTLRAMAEKLGVQIREDTEVTGFIIEGDRVCGVQTQQDRFEAGQVAICGGAWTSQILDAYQVNVNVSPVRGQMLMYRFRPGRITRIVLSKDRYAIPRRDGRVLFGSTLEHTGFEKQTTEAARTEMHARAVEMFPELAEAEIERQWAGLRPGSPQGIPYIGAHPELRNLFVNAGQFRNGVVLAPASTRLLADLMLQRTPILDPAPYAPRAGA
ncbi:MAG: NAD(P)/FAD-dependent oxidoreductase, partial [Gammaproteobacteria bacterium]